MPASGEELTSSFSVRGQNALDSLESYRVSSEIAATTHHLDSEITEGSDSRVFGLNTGCTTNIRDELRPANAQDGDIPNITEMINTSHGNGNWFPATRNPFGLLVPPGHIRIAECNGRMYAVGPGRWVLHQFRKIAGFAHWKGSPVNVIQRNSIQEGGLTICRVGPDQIGLAFEHGTTPQLLGPGLHVYNNASFSFVRNVDVKENLVQHGTFTMLQVVRGHYGLVWETPNQPRILRQGGYVVKSPTFKFEKFVSMEEQYIKHGTIHIIQVPKGRLAKVMENVTPKLLTEGVHVVDHPNFHFSGLEKLNAPLIKHGTITRFRVNQGQVGLATWQNEAVFAEVPGTYEVDSPDFIYLKCLQVSEKLIENGNKKIVTVFTGQVGISYKAGSLDILEPGRHIISEADHKFDSFLSVQQVAMRLKDPTDGDDKFVAETRDFVKVEIIADLFYSIADPAKTILRVGKEGIANLVNEAAVGTIINIVRSTALNEIAQSQTGVDASSQKAPTPEQLQVAQAMGQPAAPMFFDRAHDEFLQRLHKDFNDRYGIDIANIRFASCKILDEELSSSISKQAIMTASTQNKVANLKGKTEIATAEQDRDSRVAQIQAEQTARALQVQTESQNKARFEKAAAAAKSKNVLVAQQNEALIAKARAEADAIKLRSEAEASSIKIRAKAEGERAELLNATPLGSQLALLDIWSGTVENCNEGIDKVVYCDPSIQNAAGGNPLGLLGLGNLAGDLSKLQSLGK